MPENRETAPWVSLRGNRNELRENIQMWWLKTKTKAYIVLCKGNEKLNRMNKLKMKN